MISPQSFPSPKAQVFFMLRIIVTALLLVLSTVQFKLPATDIESKFTVSHRRHAVTLTCIILHILCFLCPLITVERQLRY